MTDLVWVLFLTKGSEDGGIWDDDTTGANGAVHCKISGDGIFSYEGTGEVNAHTFHITNADTHVDCNGQEAFMLSQIVAGDGFHRAALHVSGGYLKFLGHAVDAYVGNESPGANFPAAIFWEGGDMDVVVERIKTTGQAYVFWGVAVAANTKCWIRCSHIITGFSFCNMDSANLSAHLFIQAQTIEILSTSNAQAFLCSGGTTFINFDIFEDKPTVNVFGSLSSGEVFFNGNKHTSSRTSGTYISMSGTASLTWNVKSSVVATTGLTFNQSSSGVFEFYGNHRRTSSSGFSSRPLQHNAGTTRIYGRLDNSARTVSVCLAGADGLILQSSAVLVANAATDSVSGSSTIKSYPGCVSNKAVNASVTQSVGTLTVDATVT